MWFSAFKMTKVSESIATLFHKIISKRMQYPRKIWSWPWDQGIAVKNEKGKNPGSETSTMKREIHFDWFLINFKTKKVMQFQKST